jgi:hypothetical protein
MTARFGSGPTQRMLDWVVALIGAGAKVVKARALHGDEAPWQLRIEHRCGVTDAVLRVPRGRGIDASMVATGAAALELAERHGFVGAATDRRGSSGWCYRSERDTRNAGPGHDSMARACVG